VTAPFRNHADELDAAMWSEAQRIIESRNPDLIRLYARDGMWCDQFGCDRISEGARQILVGYVRQADAYARENPPAEKLDRYGRVRVTQ
jgi:hypothetical protein